MSCVVIGLVFIIPNLFAPKTKNYVKSRTYECGFAPITRPYKMFSINFYLVAMLFIIFDVEMIFLLPYVLNMHSLGINAFLHMQIFIGLLGVGIVYELVNKALDWS